MPLIIKWHYIEKGESKIKRIERDMKKDSYLGKQVESKIKRIERII